MITKEAIIKNRFTKKEFFVPAARIGFKHLLKSLNFKKGEKVLLPAYIGITDTEGSGVFDPVTETNTHYDFYALGRKLAIDQADFETKLRTQAFKAVLVIHYFGFAQNDMEWVCAKCKEYDVLLIEDCAHTMGSSQNGKLLGEWGDFSFFSIHKIIAADDGGILKITNNDIPIPDLNMVGQNMDPETIEQLYRTNFPLISSIRRRNYQYLLDNLHENPYIEILYPHLDQETIPLNFPILVKRNKREKLYFNLEKKGIITCSLYYRLIHQISKTAYPISHEISQNILNLPVHQDTTEEDLQLLIAALDSALSEI